MSSSSDANLRQVKGIINVKPILSGELAEVINLDLIKKWVDSITHLSHGQFSLELVAAADDLDASCEKKVTVKANASFVEFDHESKMFKYECDFLVPVGFGEIGALLVENKERKDKYINNVVLNDVNVTFTCESWVHLNKDNPTKRIFFTNKSRLPTETPAWLKSLREKDLESLRGNGEGQRKPFERIYDYDVYNDLGDPDTRSDLSRPVLGGKEHPYPRRCRTGRPMTTTEPRSESRKKLHLYDPFYVPRDEAFSDRKMVAFGTMSILTSIEQALKYAWKDILLEPANEFSSVKPEHIELKEPLLEKILEYLFDVWADFKHFENVIKVVVPKFLKDVYNNAKNVAHIDKTQNRNAKSFSWFRDDEFCRQTLAGMINPYSIQLVTEWPLKSKLPCDVYGPPESAITKEIVEKEIEGFMNLEEALEQKKLFVLDYHDLLLPYVNRVRELKGTTLYGSRTLMFLNPDDETLKPVAIELTCPPNNKKAYWMLVYIHQKGEQVFITDQEKLQRVYEILGSTNQLPNLFSPIYM